MLDSPNDKDDVAALKRGDRAAFSLLVKKYHSKMLVVARAIVGDTWAEEVIQEAWVSIYKSLSRFEERSSLKTWMYTIVKNEARTRLGKESRFVSIDASAIDASQDDAANAFNDQFKRDGHWKQTPTHWHIESPVALLEEQQLQRCIKHTLSILSADQRAVFTLRDIQQLDLGEICNILELTSSNVRVLLHRARLTLMQVINHYQETGTC